MHCAYRCLTSVQRYWLVGGVIWIYERILREVRSRHRTYISKVIQHPSNVMEIQIKKEKTTTQAGQYIFLCCPEISYFQWHPFTLTRYVARSVRCGLSLTCTQRARGGLHLGPHPCRR